jgi:hypothetical protein
MVTVLNQLQIITVISRLWVSMIKRIFGKQHKDDHITIYLNARSYN